MKEFFVDSWDGTRLCVYDSGKGDVVGILSNGLGGNIRAWQPLLDHFSKKIRFVSWDYRGLYKSGKSRSKYFYRVQDHARDLEVILDVLKIDKAIFFGWSMGVQLNFEFYRTHPEKFLALIQINGVSGKPFRKAFYGRFPDFFWELFFYFMQDGMRVFFPLVRILAQKSVLLRLASYFGLFTLSKYSHIAKETIFSWLELDMKEYVKTFRFLGQHDAEDVLPHIKVPTLIIYGSRDLFTPSKFAIDMALKIRKAEICEIENGSHYTPLEFPDEVNRAIEEFLRKFYLI